MTSLRCSIIWGFAEADLFGFSLGGLVAFAVALGAPARVGIRLPRSFLGTNDFRSSKRNFIFASLTDKEGYGVGIEAIGSQHLRASVDADVIEVNVNDWFGGTGATALGRMVAELRPRTRSPFR